MWTIASVEHKLRPVEHGDPIGAKLRQAREDAGLSAEAAGKLIGVHENTIYATERDAESRQLSLLRKACIVYGITFAQLFGEAEPRIPSEFRPLLEPLLPFTLDQRIAIIKNIASNMGFMASLYATPRGVEKGTNFLRPPYDGVHNSQTDELDVVVPYSGSQPEAEATNLGELDATARRRHHRTHQKSSRKGR